MEIRRASSYLRCSYAPQEDKDELNRLIESYVVRLMIFG